MTVDIQDLDSAPQYWTLKAKEHNRVITVANSDGNYLPLFSEPGDFDTYNKREGMETKKLTMKQIMELVDRGSLRGYCTWSPSRQGWNLFSVFDLIGDRK